MLTKSVSLNYEGANNATEQPMSGLENFIKEFRYQLERYAGCVGTLERMGHKLQDTNYPKTAKEEIKKERQAGLLGDIEDSFSLLIILNDRFEEQLNKLSAII